MNAFKWANLYTRMVFYPDDGGGGSEAAPSSSGGGGDAGGASGGANAPSASPSPGAEAPTPSESPAPSGAAPQEFDWGALGSTDDLDYIPEPPKVPDVPKAPAPTPPQAAPVAPAAQTPAPAPAAPPPAAQPTGAEGQQAAPLSAADPMGIAAGLEANRDAIVAHLAQSKFALSEQDIKDLDTDVIAAVPRLLARVFLESQVSMQKFLAQAVPGMVQKFNKVTSANDSAEKQFFAAHKGLDANNPQHRQAVVRMATVYRQANPNIPLDQLIQEVGPMVMTALRLGAVAPAAQPARRGSVGAFVPAVNGGGGLSPTPEPQNEWMGLGQNYDE